MQLTGFTLTLSLALTVLSIPTIGPVRRAPAVLSTRPYNDFQVSDGVGGNALAEIIAKFPIDLNDLAGVAKSDLEIIKFAAQVSNKAEADPGGFVEAIKAVGGPKTAEGKILAVGMIKNKVVKLQIDVMRIGILMAQGKNNGSSLAIQKKKLATNVALDVKSAGLPSKSVSFPG